MGANEREQYQYFLLAHAEMAGIEVLAFAIMPNHFHALVRVPERTAAEAAVTDEVLLSRLSAVYRAGAVAGVGAELRRLRTIGDGGAVEEFRRRFLDRMHDLSVFVKELKARFSRSYNEANGRSGPLWEDRFRSVLLDHEDPALLLVLSTYIDLNPVRAGLVDDPKDYRHCGYATAVAGDRGRTKVIARLLDLEADSRRGRAEVMAQYRMLLFGNALPSEGRRRAGVPIDKIRAVMDSHGHLPKLELLRCRVRYLTDSLALGSQGFLDSLFPGKARNPRAADLGTLRVLRDVRGPAVFAGAETSGGQGTG
ncbi:hypothetical protein BH23VER1_BH23VER1_19530 [soil metagenome]